MLPSQLDDVRRGKRAVIDGEDCQLTAVDSGSEDRRQRDAQRYAKRTIEPIRPHAEADRELAQLREF